MRRLFVFGAVHTDVEVMEATYSTHRLEQAHIQED